MSYAESNPDGYNICPMELNNRIGKNSVGCSRFIRKARNQIPNYFYHTHLSSELLIVENIDLRKSMFSTKLGYQKIIFLVIRLVDFTPVQYPVNGRISYVSPK